jgi:hypothetical protein
MTTALSLSRAIGLRYRRSLCPFAGTGVPEIHDAVDVFFCQTKLAVAIAAFALAARAFDAQHRELALDVAEYEIGSGHPGPHGINQR